MLNMALIFVEQSQLLIGLSELERELRELCPQQHVHLLRELGLDDHYEQGHDNIGIHIKLDRQQLIQVAQKLHALLSRLEITIVQEYPCEMEQVLNELIRPALYNHGGDIENTYLQREIAGFKLIGACDGCPYSLITLTSHISRVLGRYFPHILILHIE